MKNAYEILQLSENVSFEIVNLVHRRLARENHPDKKGGDEQKIKDINWARDTLIDPEKRKKHDEELRAHRLASAPRQIPQSVRYVYVPIPVFVPVSPQVYFQQLHDARVREELNRKGWNGVPFNASPPSSDSTSWFNNGATRVTPVESPRDSAMKVYVHPAEKP